MFGKGDKSWLRRLAGRFEAHEIGYTPSVSGSDELMQLLGETSLTDLGELYRTQWAVRTSANFLALNVAHVNLKTYRRIHESEREEVPHHPQALVLQQPNPQTTRFMLVRDTVSDLVIYDAAFWLKVPRRNPKRLHRLPPGYIEPTGGDMLSGPAFYTFHTVNGPKHFEPEEIVHFHGYSPTDTRVGSPVLDALRSVLREEIEASRHRQKFWSRRARIDGVITRPADAPNWDKKGRERFREGWRRFTRGGDREEETPVLEDGMDFRPIAFSPKDAEFQAGREWVLEVVATAFQIPLALLSRKNTATFASMKEFHKVLYVDVLGSWNAMIEGGIALQLTPSFDESKDIYSEFNIEEKLQGDFETQADALKSAVQVPWMSVNDARALRNKPPVGDPLDPENPYNWPAIPPGYVMGPPSGAQSPSGPRLSDEELQRMLEEP